MKKHYDKPLIDIDEFITPDCISTSGGTIIPPKQETDLGDDTEYPMP